MCDEKSNNDMSCDHATHLCDHFNKLHGRFYNHLVILHSLTHNKSCYVHIKHFFYVVYWEHTIWVKRSYIEDSYSRYVNIIVGHANSTCGRCSWSLPIKWFWDPNSNSIPRFLVSYHNPITCLHIKVIDLIVHGSTTICCFITWKDYLTCIKDF